MTSPGTRLALRVVIVALAALEIIWFAGRFSRAFRTLAAGGANPFDVAFAAGTLAVAPLFALAAGGLGIAGQRPRLAMVLLCAAALVYLLPVIVFLITISIYGY